MYDFFEYRVSDFMTAELITIGPDDSLDRAEQVLEEHDFNSLPVVDAEGHLLGLLTKLDLLRAFTFTSRSMIPPYEEIMRQPVESVMTREPRQVPPDQPVTRVLQAMVETRVRSLPVVEDRKLVGMISREDVLRALRRAAKA